MILFINFEKSKKISNSTQTSRSIPSVVRDSGGDVETSGCWIHDTTAVAPSFEIMRVFIDLHLDLSRHDAPPIHCGRLSRVSDSHNSFVVDPSRVARVSHANIFNPFQGWKPDGIPDGSKFLAKNPTKGIPSTSPPPPFRAHIFTDDSLPSRRAFLPSFSSKLPLNRRFHRSIQTNHHRFSLFEGRNSSSKKPVLSLESISDVSLLFVKRMKFIIPCLLASGGNFRIGDWIERIRAR